MALPRLDIRSSNNEFSITIAKPGGLSTCQLLAIVISVFGVAILASFIWNSATSNGVPVIKVLFVVLGFAGMYSMARQAITLVLHSNGTDVIELDRDKLRVTSRWALLRRGIIIDLSSIKGIELLDRNSVSPGLSFLSGGGAGDGAVLVQWGRRRRLYLGAFLKHTELGKLHQVLLDRLDRTLALKEGKRGLLSNEDEGRQ
jgi:hypothetical protein